MGSHEWQSAAKICKDIQQKSIRQEWLLPNAKLPAKNRLNIIEVPHESCLLSQNELMITETSAVGMVGKMAAGEWTAEEVVITFLKKATIGQQLVN
jgi:amidase